MRIKIFPQSPETPAARRILAVFFVNITLVSCVALLTTATAASESTGNSALFASVAEARDLAVAANAPGIAENEWRSAEKVWTRALKAREKGKQEAALEAAIEAQQLFGAAELRAIQNNLVFDARAAIATAESNKAKRYAPRTLARARDLVGEAERSLAADRYATQAAAALADQAIATAIHAEQITAIARKKPAAEELILQWESYLARLQKAAAVSASVDTAPGIAVEELETEIMRMQRSEQQLISDLADSHAFGAALEEEIRELDQRLGGASTERQQLVMRLEEQARAREQLAQAEGLFMPDEALVFRQSDDIVVRVIGLQFASGSADLGKSNDALLKKLEQVIAIYPRSMLLIEGHTDSRGSDGINKRLSEQRAQAVANHIITQMRIPAHRLTAAGFGAAKPIANNETAKGRAQNRRIDLIITPDNSGAF